MGVVMYSLGGEKKGISSMESSADTVNGNTITNGRPGTVFIVDDCADNRESLRLLAQSGGLESRAYGSAEEFLADFTADMAGCLVLDVRMPGMSGMELQQRLVALGSELPVIMVTGYGEIPMAVQAMQAGALDYLCKPYSPQAMLDRIHLALDQNATRRAQHEGKAKAQARISKLSQREHQVAQLLADGNSTKQIAKLLEISPKTVDNHRAKVLEKLQLSNPVELRKLLVS